MQLLKVGDESARDALVAAVTSYTGMEESINEEGGESLPRAALKVAEAALRLTRPNLAEKPLFLANNEKKRDTPEETRRYGEIGEVVDASDCRNFPVLQREYGVLPAVGTEPLYIMSSDATSCLIVAARGVLKGTVNGAEKSVSATAMGHFDVSGEDLSEGMFNMYFRSLLPALRVMADGSIDMDEMAIIKGQAVPPPISAAELHVEWYIVGGMVDDTFSLPCIADLFSHSLTALWDGSSEGAMEDQRENIFGARAKDRKFTVTHSLRPDGVCFWTDNTIFKKSDDNSGELPHCITNGLRINVHTGECHPCWTRYGTRKHPLANVRKLRFLSGYPPSPLHPLADTLDAGENTEAYRRVSHDASGVESSETLQITFLTHLQAVVKAIQRKEPLPVLVYGFPFSDLANMKNVTIEESINFSTTPQCEPADFAEEMLSAIQFGSSTNSAKIFGHPSHPLGTYAL